MADVKDKPAEDPDFGKKCAQTGTTLRRAKRYYRNGKYFINKNAYKAYLAKNKAEGAAAPAAEPEAKA